MAATDIAAAHKIFLLLFAPTKWIYTKFGIDSKERHLIRFHTPYVSDTGYIAQYAAFLLRSGTEMNENCAIKVEGAGYGI